MRQPFFLKPYGWAWRLARPFLRRHKRLSAHFAARLVPENWPADAANSAPFRLWLHAASGGEAYLARAVLAELAARARSFSVLCTSMTDQGVAVLRETRDELQGTGRGLAVAVDYFPLDEPALMREAVARVFGPPGPGGFAGAQPAVALLETEIWPGLLAACRERGARSYILNGRMTESSLRAYRHFGGTLRRLAPDVILASSARDAARFSQVFDRPGEPSRVSLMPNIKFDRVAQTCLAAGAGGRNPPLPPPGAPCPPLLLLASVRAEEEEALLGIIPSLRAAAPEAALIVAPRHLHRAGRWARPLAGLGGTRFKMRSRGFESIEASDIILWDSFGELGALYGLSRAVFVGGSLADLGGQNFLEPLAFGVSPVIGPHWSNFYWAGEELFRLGLVKQVRAAAELLPALVERLKNPPDGALVKAAFGLYLKERQGGAALAAEFLLS